MLVAVIIPFRGNAATLRWTLEGFAQQQLADDVHLEVRICGDGDKVPALPESPDPRLTFTSVETDRVGVAEAKNILLGQKPADIVIFGNSDTRPAPGFAMAHLRRLMTLPPGEMVLGSAPYEKAADGGTVFDTLKEETPMVFFYERMKPACRYGFRHCWTLNLSVRYADLQRIGFFDPRFRPYGYEDLDMGFRLLGPEKAGIFFEPAAEVLHRHPMLFEEYLDREELLGVMMPVVWAVNPEMFRALNGGKTLDEAADEITAWVKMDLASHRWTYQRMLEWCPLPAEVLGEGAARQRLLMTLYQMHVPLKRLAFRLGFLRGLELRDDARWHDRLASQSWRKVLAAHSPNI